MKFLSKLPLKIIVVLFTTLIAMFTSSLVVSLIQMNIDNASDIFQKASDQMLNRSSASSMNMSNVLYQRRLEQILQQNFITLMSFQLLYNHIQNNNVVIDFQESPQQCLYPEFVDSYNLQTGFCYMLPFEDTSNDLYFEDTMTLISILNQFAFAFQFQNNWFTYYISHQYGGLFFEVPPINEEGMIYSDEPFLGNDLDGFFPPILERENYTLNAITYRRLMNKDGSYQGILGIDFTIQEFNSYENMHNQIMSDTGQIIRQGYYYSYNLPYIYNQSITGFNYLDWLKLQNGTQVDLYNSIINSEVIVNIIYLSKYCLRLIMYQMNKTRFEDTSPYKLQAQLIIFQLMEWKKENLIIYLQVFLISSLVVILLQVLIISQILRPLEMIVQIICQTWINHSIEDQKDNLLFNLHRQEIGQVPIFNSLYRIIQYNANTYPYKSQICSSIEDITYPVSFQNLKQNSLLHVNDLLLDQILQK